MTHIFLYKNKYIDDITEIELTDKCIPNEVKGNINRNIYTIYDVVGEVIYIDECIEICWESSTIEIASVSHLGHGDDDFCMSK